MKKLLAAGLCFAIIPLATSAWAARCPAPGAVRSIDSHQPAAIRFVNSSNRPLQFYWLDFRGDAQFYRELMPGQSYVQRTFLTHPWIALGPRGNCVGRVMRATRPGMNLIEIFGD